MHDVGVRRGPAASKKNSSVLHEWSGTFIRGWREGADLWLDERRAFCGSPRRTEVEQMKGNTIKLITLSLIAVALSTTAALAQRECAGLAFCGGGGYGWTPSPPYRGIATPPAEAYSVPAKA